MSFTADLGLRGHAVNLIKEPAYANVRLEMIRRLGLELQKDPRFVGYWAEFRIARFHELPTIEGRYAALHQAFVTICLQCVVPILCPMYR